MRYPTYDSAPVPMLAQETTYAYDKRQFNYFIEPDTTPVPVLKSLEHLYSPLNDKNPWGLSEFKYPVMYIPVDADAAIKAGVVSESKRDAIQEYIFVDLLSDQYVGSDQAISCSGTMTLDILASSIAQGWSRPVYVAMTVPDKYYLGLQPYMQSTGMAYEITPIRRLGPDGEITTNTDKAFENVTKRFRWAGIDTAEPGSLYLDETIRRMVTTTRSTINDLAYMLIYEGAEATIKMKDEANDDEKAKLQAYATERFDKARIVLKLMEEKLPAKACPYSVMQGLNIAQTWDFLAQYTDNKDDRQHTIDLLESEIMHYGMFARFYQSLDANQYGRLTREDIYIDQRYIGTMIYMLQDMSEDRAKDVMQRLIDAGVNVKRSLNFLVQSNQQAQQAQEVAAVEEEVVADTTGGFVEW